ncbi:MAG: PQQ-binding-like beta-propeller repeat protein [Bacteroidetes bacterium]|nr:PQQ-binding-like beta-propeller repeat protein [Bacteroidota bacterium]
MNLKNFTYAVLFMASSLFAQKAETPQYSYDMGGKISFMKLTDAGVLVVAGSGGLGGIKPGASQTHFLFKDYGKIKPEELDFIPMSPYVIINEGGMFSTKKAVIDYVSGKKLFATEDNNWRFTNRADIMLPENKLVISGIHKEKGVAVGVYDLLDGKEVGIVPFKPKMGQQFLTTPVIIDGGLLVGTDKSLLRLDINNGTVVWENKDVDKISWVTADETGKEIYAFENKGGNTRIHKISSSGQKLWDKERKVKGIVTRFEILPNGLACVSDVDNSGKKGIGKLASGASESKIAFLSAQDGSDLWEKAPKTKGYVQHFYIMDDGILFGLQDGGINKVSFDGVPLFRKPMKTGENIHTMAMTPKGMIYITDSDCNIINLNTGESIWNKELKYKRAKSVTSGYDSKNKRYLISTGEEIMAIDENTGEVSSLATFKFDGKEYPNNLILRNEGILLTSDQNMMMLDFNGSQKFHEYYKAPGKSAAGAILMGALTVASAAASVSSHMAAEQHRHVHYTGGSYYTLGDYTSTGESYKEMANAFANAAGASFAEMTRRFSATAATENTQFILTKLDSGDVGLVKVNKDSGTKEKEISLKDKKPEYEVDELGGYLYYKANNNTIYSYDLKK